ncbi:hypothetical protein HDU67_003907 [Dinochytrium kinnereticum]|nr:hypothetical protein HDU67_003907 [Dinochytrium kinnereticum]
MRKKVPKSLVQPPRPVQSQIIPAHRTQKIISTYHALNKYLATCLKRNDHDAADRIRKQLEDMGGLDAYQKASLRGGDERKGKGACGKWLAPKLKAQRQTFGVKDNEKIRLLDVGAVNGQTYSGQSSWISVTSIDLNPQHSSIEKQDFFDRPLPMDDSERFHVLCFSLVVNFVGEPDMRVLPLPCVTNSRYLTHIRLTDIMKTIGFEETDKHFTTKLAHFVYRRREAVKSSEVTLFKKEEINPGSGRNNFAIVLKPNPL